MIAWHFETYEKRERTPVLLGSQIYLGIKQLLNLYCIELIPHFKILGKLVFVKIFKYTYTSYWDPLRLVLQLSYSFQQFKDNSIFNILSQYVFD